MIAGTSSIWLERNKYEHPPIKARADAILIATFIPINFNIKPENAKATKSEHAKYTEFTNTLPGKYLR